MCLAVYIATDRPAPAVPWDEARPAFNTQPLTDTEHAVRARFRRANVMYLGAHTGCACGFSYGTRTASNAKPDEVAAARESTASLRRYLERLLQSETEVELFACWEGDQGKSEIARRVVAPGHFGGDEFEFVEREFLVVQGHSPRHGAVRS